MAVILPRDAKNARKQTRTGSPIRTPRSVEVEYRKALQQLNKSNAQATRLIGRSVSAGVPRAQILQMIQQQIAASRLRYEQAAARLPASMTQSLSTVGKTQVENMVKRAMGVDFARIVDSPAVAEQLQVSQLRNAQLITKLPEEHWARVVQAVSDNYDGTISGSLTKNLTKINGIGADRAKVIARDQTAKLSSDLARIRQEEAGIEEYIWRNSQDTRVVGNPGGLYPRGNQRHRDHWSREGKTYKWSDPPSDGHPGQPILCRCRAEPIIDLDKINAQFV